MRAQQAGPAVSRAKELLDSTRGKAQSPAELLQRSLALAALLLEESERQTTGRERRRSNLLAALMRDDDGQALTTLLTDRVYRSRDPARVVDVARHLLRGLGVPCYLPLTARAQLRALLHAGPFAPRTAASGLLDRLRADTEHVIVPAEDPALASYLARRRAEGVRVNVNHLGEAVLGEAEAAARVEDYVALLDRSDIESISVKVSSIFSQIDLLAWNDTLERVSARLRVIYRAALGASFERKNGERAPKLVNLDMESFRDLRLTLDVFMRILDEPEFLPLSAGVVLQAYLPDSLPLQQRLTEWAIARAGRGGAAIRLRIVKGANLLTERTEAALRGWPVPVYGTKAEVDASFKAMLDFGCQSEHARAVELGIASHNLFDIAYGMLLRAEHAVEDHVGFELLEGMADPLQRAVCAVAGSALVYAPLCDRDAMQTAIAYLMRRLDENTSEENFLRHSFGMRPRDAAFEREAERFGRALGAKDGLGHASLRVQDRRTGAAGETSGTTAFTNEPDTDFALAHNREWLMPVLDRWRERPGFELPIQVAGMERTAGPMLEGFDPSRPGLVPYRFAVADDSELERALECGVAAGQRFAGSTLRERSELLTKIARGLRAERGELIAAMLLDAGKRVEQADAEVSEAIDFAEYYARSFVELAGEHPELEFGSKSLALVTPPWNFPLAIPAGGVFAALMAGSAVLLKPALETALVGERLARLCWEAGVPRELLQLVTCEDQLGSKLVRDARIGQVILTGATATARLFHELRPGIPLAAETGGKNAIIVSALADRDEAIKDALASAFGHAGQKCSACSLLICEAEVLDDETFLRALCDAAQSLPVGSAWNLRNVVTPLIRPPEGALQRALTRLEPGEAWLLEPEFNRDNPRVVSPGIKLGVASGGFTHTTELFGPVLGVMRADDLDQALELANATPYGLTAGLHSLDEREQKRWIERIQAGNLYVNRPITGAIVERQPFGGFKASGIGPGAKAGGPNYVAQMARISQRRPPAVNAPPAPAALELLAWLRPQLDESARERLGLGACAYADARRTHFAADRDPGSVLGERNLQRYVRCQPLLLRASADAAPSDLLLSALAALTADIDFELSLHPRPARSIPNADSMPGVKTTVEDALGASERLQRGFVRVRAIGSPEPELAAAAAAAFVHLASEPVLLSGRFELLHYYREQSLSHRYHRYGNLAAARLLRPPRPA